MSSVIPIFKRGHFEIHGGIVASASITDAAGTRPDMSNVGHYRFGGRAGMWDGSSYDDAIREAEAMGHESGIPVHDLVVGGAK